MRLVTAAFILSLAWGSWTIYISTSDLEPDRHEFTEDMNTTTQKGTNVQIANKTTNSKSVISSATRYQEIVKNIIDCTIHILLYMTSALLELLGLLMLVLRDVLDLFLIIWDDMFSLLTTARSRARTMVSVTSGDGLQFDDLSSIRNSSVWNQLSSLRYSSSLFIFDSLLYLDWNFLTNCHETVCEMFLSLKDHYLSVICVKSISIYSRILEQRDAIFESDFEFKVWQQIFEIAHFSQQYFLKLIRPYTVDILSRYFPVIGINAALPFHPVLPVPSSVVPRHAPRAFVLPRAVLPDLRRISSSALPSNWPGFLHSGFISPHESLTTDPLHSTHSARHSCDWFGGIAGSLPGGWDFILAGAILLLLLLCCCVLILVAVRLAVHPPSHVVYNNYTYNFQASSKNQLSSQPENHVKLVHADSVDSSFDSNLCFDSLVKIPVPDDDYPGKDEVLLYSKSGLFGVNSWPCTRSQTTVVVAQEEAPRVPEEQVPELSIDARTTTDDTDSNSSFSASSQAEKDGLLKVPHQMVPKPKRSSSRETTPERRIANRINSRIWESDMKTKGTEQSSGDDGDVSSSSVESSQSKPVKKDNSKWITKDGEYDLDKGKSCQLGFITEYLAKEGADEWKSELSSSIEETFDMRNSNRYKVTFKHGGTSCTSDKSDFKKHGRKPKVSELSWNLDDGLEISKLIESYQRKTSGVISEVFGTEIEFDETVVHRISDLSGSIAYENSAIRDPHGGELSPTVAIVSLGLSTPRPLYLRTIGNKVTHKISLGSGSMCFFHGNTELRYQRSIPKGFGTDEDQFFIFFIQRTPTVTPANPKINTLEMEADIPHQPATPTNSGNITDTHSPAMTPRPDEDLINSTPQDQDLINSTRQEQPEVEEEPQDKSVDSIRLKTPPSPPKIQRRLSSIPHLDGIQFRDSLDYEVGEGLILAETISAAVENMSEEVVTAELARTNTSTAGTAEDKRRRLQNKICMSIGELSVSAANNSVNFMKVDSPVDHNVSVLQDDLESIANSQKLIETTLKHLVDSLVSMDGEIKDLKAERTEKSLTESSKQKKTKSYDTNQYMINREFAESKEQLDLLNRNITDLQNKLGSISDEISDFKAKTADILTEAMKDIQKYQASVFSDESQRMIKEIHAFVNSPVPEGQDSATVTEEREESEEE